MFTYYLDLAVRSLRRNVALTILMIVAIAFGVGASMTTLTVMHVLSQDPIPAKSDRLFYVQLDARKMEDFRPNEEPNYQSTRLDAENLLRAKKGKRQVMDIEWVRVIDRQCQEAGVAQFFKQAYLGEKGIPCEEPELDGKVVQNFPRRSVPLAMAGE